MAKAIWNGVVIAESERHERLEGNIYFPPESLRRDYFSDSDTTSRCPWKGTAHYLTVTVDGAVNKDAAWFYPEPKPAAGRIAGYVAFWRGVEVVP